MINDNKIKNDESKEKNIKNKEVDGLNIIYLIVLIILLILCLIISFKTGENLYYLLNTNIGDQSSDLSTDVAAWKFDVRIEY